MQREGVLRLVDQGRTRAWLWQCAESVFVSTCANCRLKVTLGPVSATTGIEVRGLCCVIGTGTAVDFKGGREWDHGAEWCGQMSD